MQFEQALLNETQITYAFKTNMLLKNYSNKRSNRAIIQVK